MCDCDIYTYIDENETDKLCRVPPYDIIHVAKLVHSVVKYVKRIHYSVHTFFKFNICSI